MGATTVEGKAFAPTGAPTESKRRRRTRGRIRRSFPTAVSTASGSKGLSQPPPVTGAVPPLRRAFHHAWRLRASEGASPAHRVAFQSPRQKVSSPTYPSRLHTFLDSFECNFIELISLVTI